MSAVDRRDIVREVDYGYNPSIGLNGLVSITASVHERITNFIAFYI